MRGFGHKARLSSVVCDVHCTVEFRCIRLDVPATSRLYVDAIATNAVATPEAAMAKILGSRTTYHGTEHP
jgi:hypothetical protein